MNFYPKDLKLPHHPYNRNWLLFRKQPRKMSPQAVPWRVSPTTEQRAGCSLAPHRDCEWKRRGKTLSGLREILLFTSHVPASLPHQNLSVYFEIILNL